MGEIEGECEGEVVLLETLVLILEGMAEGS